MLVWLFDMRRKWQARGEAARLHQEANSRKSLEEIVTEVAHADPRALTTDETEKASKLASSDNENALRLACVAVSATGCQQADVAAVFTPHVLKRIAESSLPACWPDVAQAIHRAPPCLDLFRLYVIDRLRRTASDAWVRTGFMDHVFPNLDWQKPYKVLLETDVPHAFIDALLPQIRTAISMSRLNMNMIGSYYVYSFSFETLDTLSQEGARILASLPAQGQNSFRPFWEPYGRHLLLSRILTLSDGVADSLSNAKRDILFGDLRAFPDTPGHVKLAKRLATQRHLVLGAYTQLSPAVAEILGTVTTLPPTKLRELLYCDLTTVQDRNRALFVAGGVPDILQ